MKVKQGTLWVNIKPTGDSIPYGFDEDTNSWIPCDGAYGVSDYLYTIKEYEKALEYFDNAIHKAINDGLVGGTITLPANLGGFVFTFSTHYEGNQE